jgi:hypothetical protein
MKSGVVRMKDEICEMKGEIGCLKSKLTDVEDEVSYIKGCITQIGDYLMEEVNFNLAEILYRLELLAK